MGMARKEVLVQLDDELVARLDKLADEQHISRSELLRRGAMAVLDAAEMLAADHDLQASYRRIPQDPGLVESARRLAASSTTEW